jgi:hypothetical protein
MKDLIEQIGNWRIDNLAETFGVLADTIEVIGAVVMMIGGIFITHRIQKWADKAGDQPAAANTGYGGGAERRTTNTMRD